MKCGERETLFFFAHEMLKPSEAEVVRLHLATCPGCARVVEEYRGLDAVLEGWKVVEPPEWFDVRVRARVATSGKPHRRFLGLGKIRATVAGALGVVLIVAGLIAMRQYHRPEARTRAAASPMASPVPALAPEATLAAAMPASLSADQEVKMYENLKVLEDYDMLANFDVLSELPQAKNN